jgi:hypothetical protein
MAAAIISIVVLLASTLSAIRARRLDLAMILKAE